MQATSSRLGSRVLLIFFFILGFIPLVIGVQEKPVNIVLIFADDLGFGDLGSYGALGYTTPNLDKMASEGMRFTNFEVSQAICSASRAAILTGCYSNRVGIGGALNPHSKIGLNPDEETLAELVKRGADYKTAIFGKWHLGHLKPFLPLQQGFDEYVGIPYSNDMWKWTYDMQLATEKTHARKASFPELPLLEGNDVFKTIEDLNDQAELTTIYTERAVEFIHQNKEKPFLLVVPHSMPHVPLAVSDKFKGKSKQGLYGDVIMEIDWSVGEIIKALEKNGLSENTLLVFFSDNGPWSNFGDHAGSTAGLREGKATIFEGGHRVPCIIKWPAQVQAGTVCNELASTIDLFPTIAEILDLELPSKKIDGISILPLLKGLSGASPRSIFYYYYGNSLNAVRRDHWKLVFPHEHRTYSGVAPGAGGIDGDTRMLPTELSLYDLRRDPGERYNVLEYYPDIVRELQLTAQQARDDLGDDLLGIKGKNVRIPGHISNY